MFPNSLTKAAMFPWWSLYMVQAGRSVNTGMPMLILPRRQVPWFFCLFPAGIIDPGDLHNYKRILYKDIRYDHILLSMVQEAGENIGMVWDKFYLQGFSGGGQFVHRFFYLHPQHLKAVSIGAPGNVTLLDDDRPWWVGGGDFKEKFGWNPDLSAMRRVAVHMIVGEQDTDTWEITFKPDWPTWVEGANDAGENKDRPAQEACPKF